MKKLRKAERRPPFHVTGKCDCMVCTEIEQLGSIAAHHPEPQVRVMALGFAGMIQAVSTGKCGAGVELKNLFD